MTSVPPQDETPWWTRDEALCDALLQGVPYGVRLSIHNAPERYWESGELVALKRKQGERNYLQVKLYVLVPDIHLQVALYDRPSPTGAIGHVAESEWTGMRHQQIGDAQAWYYPEERLLVLWEIVLWTHYREARAPVENQTLLALWQAFEEFLLREFPLCERIITPGWEPVYDEDPSAWPAFLAKRGFVQVGGRKVFEKCPKTLTIPGHIVDLVAELDRLVKAANFPGIPDEQAESASLCEAEVQTQLGLLGWGAVLNEHTERWVPCPAGYTIVHNPPDPLYYPQRRYSIPEHPDRWEYLWCGKDKRGFLDWDEAYAFVFVYDAQAQAHLPLQRYCVRPPDTWGGNDYVAWSAEQAVQMHRNYWCAVGWLTPAKAVQLPLQAFEHCGDRGFYCRACQHAPCKYTPAEQWPLAVQNE